MEIKAHNKVTGFSGNEIYCLNKLGLTAGPNPYVYVDNDPVNFTDPGGLWWSPCDVLEYATGITGFITRSRTGSGNPQPLSLIKSQSSWPCTDPEKQIELAPASVELLIKFEAMRSNSLFSNCTFGLPFGRRTSN